MTESAVSTGIGTLADPRSRLRFEAVVDAFTWRGWVGYAWCILPLPTLQSAVASGLRVWTGGRVENL